MPCWSAMVERASSEPLTRNNAWSHDSHHHLFLMLRTFEFPEFFLYIISEWFWRPSRIRALMRSDDQCDDDNLSRAKKFEFYSQLSTKWLYTLPSQFLTYGQFCDVQNEVIFSHIERKSAFESACHCRAYSLIHFRCQYILLTSYFRFAAT